MTRINRICIILIYKHLIQYYLFSTNLKKNFNFMTDFVTHTNIGDDIKQLLGQHQPRARHQPRTWQPECPTGRHHASTKGHTYSALPTETLLARLFSMLISLTFQGAESIKFVKPENFRFSTEKVAKFRILQAIDYQVVEKWPIYCQNF